MWRRVDTFGGTEWSPSVDGGKEMDKDGWRSEEKTGAREFSLGVPFGLFQ